MARPTAAITPTFSTRFLRSARKYPLILWHGFGQFSKTWETTPDGREGYQNIFLRRGFGVYVLDQPRRGDAGRSMVEATLKPTPDEQMWFGAFRIGIWPNYFPGVQFSRDPQALDQYFRQMTPNIGPFDLEVVTDAASQLLNRTGPAILVTHSQAGGPGWVTAIKNSERSRHRCLRARQQFRFRRGRGTAAAAELEWRSGSHRDARCRIQEAHADSDRHLLR